MIVEPVRLAGRSIHLVPLTLDHAPDLYRHAGPDVFRWVLEFPRDDSFEAFRDWLRATAVEAPASLPFAIVLADTGEPIGSTGFLEIRERHRGLEIGRTWIGKTWQGTKVNPESKYLLLRHAFETLDVLRVQLKTDSNNLHSQRAIEKLGAVREGVLRNYQIRSTGLPRHTVVYSIIADEWPAVKARLEARLREEVRV